MSLHVRLSRWLIWSNLQKIQIRRICKLLAIFFIFDCWNFRCLEFYHNFVDLHCSTIVLTLELQYTAVYCTYTLCGYSSNAGAPEDKTSIFTNATGTVHGKRIRSPKKKRNIAASTSVYMEMVNNQLLRQIYQSDYPRRARISGSID